MNDSTTEVKNYITQPAETAYIYILSHISNTLVKVGETAVCPSSREKDYIRKYELKGFSLKRTFKVASSQRKDIEKHSHQILKRFQVSGIDRAREIFACSLEEAVGAVQNAIAQNAENKKFEKEKAERRKSAERKRAKEIQKKRELEELHEHAEKAWENSKLRRNWDEKLSAFETDFPLKKKVGLCFELSRFRFNLGVGLWMYWGIVFPISGLAVADTTGSWFPFTVFLIYLVIALLLGGTFSRSNSEITDEKNTQKYKSLKEQFASAKYDFIRTWKSSNKNPAARSFQTNYPSWRKYPDMRQTMSQVT